MRLNSIMLLQVSTRLLLTTTTTKAWQYAMPVARVFHHQQRRTLFRWSNDIVNFATRQDEYDTQQQQQQQQQQQFNVTSSIARNSTLDIVDLATESSGSSGSEIASDAATATTTEKTDSKTTSAATTTKEDTTFLAINPKDVQIVAWNVNDADNDQEENQNNNNDYTTVSNPNDIVNPNGVEDPTFVNMFRGSANYIANHRNTLAVYHIPGDLMEFMQTSNDNNSSFLRDLMNDIALSWLLGMKIVIVAGCRYQIDQRIPNRPQHHGIAVTDQETLRVVKEEAGYVRFEIERQLARSLRMQGVGGGAGTSRTNTMQQPPLSPQQQANSMMNGYVPSPGSYNENNYYNNAPHNPMARMENTILGDNSDGNVVSGNFYSAQPFGILDGVDYKYTGFVRRVEVEKIRQVHAHRDIVLLTSLGVSPSGEAFNVNSESLAATVAGALDASKIIFFTERDVELRHRGHGKKIPHLRVKDAHNLLRHNTVNVHKRGFVNLGDDCPQEDAQKSMLIKIGWGMHALEQGVKRAHIISPKHGALLQELYTRDGSGTMLSRDLYDGIRQAKVEDVSAIYELITPLVQMGTLVDRPRTALEKSVDAYHVYTRDDLVVACGQLKLFEDGFAEIGCLVVDKNYRARGRGDAMLGYLERLSVQKGAQYIFVLSTQTMEWFIERGFDEVTVDKLPPSRRAVYDTKRNSKIYMKKINSIRDLDASELWWNR